MIPIRRSGVGGRFVVGEPFAKSVGLPLEFAGLDLLVWKLRFHLTANEEP
jgi:hypothetical protein